MLFALVTTVIIAWMRWLEAPSQPPAKPASRPAQRPVSRPPQGPAAARPEAVAEPEPKTATPETTVTPPDSTLQETPEVPDPSPKGPSIIRGERLGGGGLGDVYRAQFEGTEVALKIMKPADEDDEKQNEKRVRLFKREVELLADLDGKGTLPRLHSKKIYRDGGGRLFFLMELIQGETLKRQVNRGKLLSRPDEILPLVSATASGLAELHERHVIHRDLNPANIMLSPSGPRLIDVGVGRRLNPKRTATYAIYGTTAYLAPEMALGKPATTETDVFGWGLTMANALTGLHIYPDTDDSHILTDAAFARFDPAFFGALNDVAIQGPWHRSLVAIIKGCLSAHPHDRPSDGRDLQVAAGALQRVLPASMRPAQQRSDESLQRALGCNMIRGMSQHVANRLDDDDTLERLVAESVYRLLRLPPASEMLQRGIAAPVFHGLFIESVVPATHVGGDRFRSPVYWEDQLRHEGLNVERTRDGLLVFSKLEIQEAR